MAKGNGGGGGAHGVGGAAGRSAGKGVSRQQFLRQGMRGVDIKGRLDWKTGSFDYLKGGGKVTNSPITFGVAANGRRYVIDGRHRTTLAKERGDKTIHAKVVAYGPRMGVLWTYEGPVKI
jgi:hypothetical protein